MSNLTHTDIKTRFLIEIRNNDKGFVEDYISDTLAKSTKHKLIELITYKPFPVGTKLNIYRLQERLLGQVIHVEPYIQDLKVLTIKIFSTGN